MERTVHEGRNVKRIREVLGIKQEALAIELGDDWNQKKVSLLEQKETIEPNILAEIAKALKVPVDTIKNFDADQAIHNINNNFHDNSIQNQFQPLEKVIELYEVKIVALYERLLNEKEMMIEELKKMIKR